MARRLRGSRSGRGLSGRITERAAQPPHPETPPLKTAPYARSCPIPNSPPTQGGRRASRRGGRHGLSLVLVAPDRPPSLLAQTAPLHRGAFFRGGLFGREELQVAVSYRQNCLWQRAGMAEQVDAVDLKSAGLRPWGFESLSRHHRPNDALHDIPRRRAATRLDCAGLTLRSAGERPPTRQLLEGISQ